MHFPWLSDIYHQLIDRVSQQQIPHAMLFSGQTGLGKAALTRTFAQYLLCDQPDKDNKKACGQCKGCLLFESESHPDFKWFEPEIDPKTKKQSKQIKINQVRSLISFIDQSSQQGKYKIAVVSPANSLGPAAANALLKTLEEPTPHSLLILHLNLPGMLLPTIRSRCQVIHFRQPDTQVALDWLASVCPETSIDQQQQALNLASGSPLLAKQYIEDDVLAQQVKIINDLGQVLKRQVSLTQVAEEWKQYHLADISQWMLNWASAMAKYAMTGRMSGLDEKTVTILSYLAQKNNPQKLTTFYQEQLEKRALIFAPNNLNPVMILESMLMSWCSLMPGY